jgi:hypothetical protein
LIAQEELLHQHTNEMAAQVAEVAAHMEFEQPPVQEHINVRLEHDDHVHDHHIEMKEGHACSADCPEHGHSHHIESKAHIRSADCPEHGGKHSHEAEHHHEHDSRKDHHIEQKAHVCGADCPEHGHKHAVTEHDRHEHHIETKRHEHKCSPDCPEHGNAHVQHEHERQHTTREAEHHAHHEAVEAPKQARAEHAPADTAPYRRIEEVVRHAQLAENEERIIAQRVDRPQAEAVQVHEASTKAELIDVVADQALRHELQSLVVANENAAPDTLLPLTENETEQSETVDPLASLENITLAIPDISEAASDALSEPLEFDELSPPLDTNSSEIVTARLDYSETLNEIGLAETIEPLEAIGIEPAVLPLPEAMQEQEPLLIEVDLSDETAEPPHVPAIVSIEKTVETLAEAISQRIDELEEQIVTAAPEQTQEIRKILNILTNLQASPAHERNLETLQKRLVHLLRLLGYENPAETLAVYRHQYGIGFTDELLARLLELIGQGRSFESLPAAHTVSTFATQQTKGVTVLGMLALALFKLRDISVAAQP